jgi:hypothetical protein
MPRTIQQRVTFRASPDKLFDIYLSSRKHTAATGAKAVMSRKVGGKFTAHGEHLKGRNVAIVPKRLIVQAWRATNWKKGDLETRPPPGALLKASTRMESNDARERAGRECGEHQSRMARLLLEAMESLPET